MNSKNLLLVVFLIAGIACGDQSFENITTYQIAKAQEEGIVRLTDSTPIEKGLFFRQLSENGYSDIFGHGKYILPDEIEERNFQIILLSCNKGDVRQKLIATIHPVYHTIIDIRAFDPQKLMIRSIQRSSAMPSFTDILLLDRRPRGIRQDSSIMQIAPSGSIEDINLCCDF